MLKFLKETSFVDMLPIDICDEESPGKLTDLYISLGDKKALASLGKRKRTCAQCGKEFDITSHRISEYVYKEICKGKRTYFCSWTCMSRNRKEREHGNKKGE